MNDICLKISADCNLNDDEFYSLHIDMPLGYTDDDNKLVMDLTHVLVDWVDDMKKEKANVVPMPEVKKVPDSTPNIYPSPHTIKPVFTCNDAVDESKQ